MADAAQKARVQVATFVAEVRLKHLPKERAAALPTTMTRRSCATLLVLTALGALALGAPGSPQTRQGLSIRGHEQSLYVYGSTRADPVIVSSGDGGWIHLGPHVAEFLSAHGFFVIGFDVKAYLESFTEAHATLRPEEEPRDYKVLAEFARTATGKKPVLIGVSEGAGLSVLAATDPQTRDDLVGVVGLGLPNLNELAWRWKDAVIYLTHRAPNEPAFSAADVAGRIAPLPLAAIHSTHDEFVPLAEVEKVLSAANEPKRLWVVDASNHRFSDNVDEFDKTLLDAIAWVKEHSPR
jgi:virulence protein VirJ